MTTITQGTIARRLSHNLLEVSPRWYPRYCPCGKLARARVKPRYRVMQQLPF